MSADDVRGQDRARARADRPAVRGQPRRAACWTRRRSRHARGAARGGVVRARRSRRAGGAGARDAARRSIHQVHTVAQAREAAEHGVDLIIAQGSEAGGQGMVRAWERWRWCRRSSTPSRRSRCWWPAAWRTGAAWPPRWRWARRARTSAPASWRRVEAGASEAWKQRILEIESEEAVRFEAWSAIMPRRRRLRRGAAGDPHRLRRRAGRDGPTRRASGPRSWAREIMATVREGRAARDDAVHGPDRRADPRAAAGRGDRAEDGERGRGGAGGRGRAARLSMEINGVAHIVLRVNRIERVHRLL